MLSAYVNASRRSKISATPRRKSSKSKLTRKEARAKAEKAKSETLMREHISCF